MNEWRKLLKRTVGRSSAAAIFVAVLMVMLPTQALAWQFYEETPATMSPIYADIPYHSGFGIYSYTLTVPAHSYQSGVAKICHSTYVWTNMIFGVYQEVKSYAGYMGGNGFTATQTGYYAVYICWGVDWSVGITPSIGPYGYAQGYSKIWVIGNLWDTTAGRYVINYENSPKWTVFEQAWSTIPMVWGQYSQDVVHFDTMLVTGHHYHFDSKLFVLTYSKCSGFASCTTITNIGTGGHHADCYYLDASIA